MKTKKIILLTAILTISTLSLFAQNPPHPNGGNNPNPTSNGTVGSNGPSGAPIDGGLSIFLVLAAAYAGRKVRVENRE
ncbi:MAG: hypothetical protein WCL00_13245 [Bacteroidota bacterium]